jgi:hypothetical protein
MQEAAGGEGIDMPLPDFWLDQAIKISPKDADRISKAPRAPMDARQIQTTGNAAVQEVEEAGGMGT